MKYRPKQLIELDKVSVVHFNPGRGYLSYLEEGKDGKYNCKGILLGMDMPNNDI